GRIAATAGHPQRGHRGGRRTARDVAQSDEPRKPLHQADRPCTAGVTIPFVLTAAAKDIRRRLRDPSALAMWMGLPIVIGLLMSLLSSGGGPAVKSRLLVVDEDKSFLSGLVLSSGRQGQLGEMLEIETLNAVEGRKKIDAGEASALLTIPRGFQDGVLNDRPVALALVTNPAQRIMPGIIEEALK